MMLIGIGTGPHCCPTALSEMTVCWLFSEICLLFNIHIFLGLKEYTH